MTATSPQTLDDLRARLVHLVEACPADQCNPVDCPLFELRQMTAHERLGWFKALDEDDLKYLAAYHYVCLNVRLRDLAHRPVIE